MSDERNEELRARAIYRAIVRRMAVPASANLEPQGSMSPDCEHEWRLLSERETGPAPGFEDEPFIIWRRWYCTKCRTVETLQDPSAEEAEAQRLSARERERIQREAWVKPITAKPQPRRRYRPKFWAA